MSGRAALAGTTALAAAITAGLTLLGEGALAAPPAGSWDELDRWYEVRGASTAIVSLVRVIATAGAGWLAAVSLLQVVVTASDRTPRARRVVDRVSPAFLRALAHGAASLSVTAGLAVPSLSGGPGGNPPGTAVMVPLDTTTTTSEPAATTVPEPPARPPAEPATTAPEAVPAIPPAAPPDRDQIVVAAGDSFWSIAVEEAGSGDVAAYWRALVERNRARLVDPANPDLLYPGQVLDLVP